MGRTIQSVFTFNRGIVSRLALARTDLKRMALSAETMTNWVPRVLGSMMLRPGLGYLGSTATDAKAFYIPFVFSTSDTALLELTNSAMRVWISDALMSRPSVSSVVTNGGFTQYTTTATISNASPAIVTYVGADNFANNDPVTFTTTGGLPNPLVVGTTYYVKNLNAGANTFEISSTPGGASINTTSAGSGTHTVAAYYFITGWTDSDEAGGVSTWVSGNLLGLTGNGTAAAIRDQTVTVAGGDIGVEHALRIVISRGPVTLRVGSSTGADDYIKETTLLTGTHSLALTPTGNFSIRFLSRVKRQVLVTSCNVEGSGTVSITAPWLAADLSKIRFDQSGDVIFVAADGYQQRRIERRATRSWSVVLYQADDGPFLTENIGPITITPAALSGNTTLTASAALFRSTHVGALFRVTSSGQRVTATITAENTFTGTIRITGVGAQRAFTITRSGLSGTGSTVTLQRSLDAATGPFEDVTTYTTDATITFNDALDNQIAYYRIGVKTGGYVAGTIVLTLSYSLGSVNGIGRVTGFTSSTLVNVEVITDFGGTAATDIWAEGQWSSLRGFPTSVAFYEGRLWWAGRDNIWGSISDAFESYDEFFEGDAGPISRSIGSGPIDRINWLLAMQRLLAGTDGAEISCRSSSFDEPLTPTNFNVKDASTQGSAQVAARKVDSRGVFVQRGGSRLYELAYDVEINDYKLEDLTALVPDIGEPSIIRLAIQRQPDTRIHCIRSDGKVAMAVFDRTENVLAWLTIETDGLIEDATVLPGTTEDRVYYVVNRTINGVTKRYLEKWALESEARGTTLNKQADAFITYSGAATTTITGLSHLEGKSVVVWGNGKDLGTKTVSGGQITGLSESVTSAVVGLAYTGQWKSTKLVYSMDVGLLQKKKITRLGVVLADAHPQGLKFGRDFTSLDDMPLMEGYVSSDQNTIRTSYDEESMPFPGEWDTDARLCLQAQAPRPCTVLAAVIAVEGYAKD